MRQRLRIEYAFYERAVMRVLFAAVVALHMPFALAGEKLSAPNGLARLVDLRFLLNPQVFAISQDLLWASLVLYVFQIGWSVALPYMALLSIAVGSIQNSQGAIGHHLQIVGLVLLAQTAAYFYSRFFAVPKTGATSENRMIDWSLQAIAVAYFVSAVTKLMHTGGQWFWQSPLVAVQIVKTTDQEYYDTLDAGQLSAGMALAEWMMRHPVLVALTLSTGLLVELSSPLLLLGRRWAAAYGVALLFFHEAVGRAMKLDFLYNEYLIWIYLVNVPFWIGAAVLWLRRRVRA